MAAAALTPPSSSHGRATGAGDWSFSVPVDGVSLELRTPTRGYLDIDFAFSPNLPRQNDTPEPTFRERIPSMPHRRAPLDGRPLNEHDHVPQSKHVATTDPKPSIIPSTPVVTHVYSPQPQHLVADENYAPHAVDYNRSTSPDHLAAPRDPMLRRQDSNISSNHDGDSVFDLYGGRLSTVSGMSAGSYAQQNSTEGFPNFVNGASAVEVDELEADPSNWIHRDKLAEIEAVDAGGGARPKRKDETAEPSRWIDRDKLAKIESQELQQAGFRSRASSGGTYRREDNDQKKLGIASSDGSHHQQLLHDPEGFNNDLRTPEEQAADRTPIQPMPSRQPRRNPSYSRIPVPTSTPCPIPQGYIERSVPLLRNSITPSGSDEGRTDLAGVYIRARKRSHSAGSALLLDDQDHRTVPTPGPLSNPKNPNRGPMSPTAKSRPSSRTASQLRKDRTRSNPQLHRPGTSASYANAGAAGTQPSTGKHHPEGPPPWSLQSYKPDPSLPPDQQIIPTVAKRMQQEQWERDGAYASVYDRELRPLKVLGDEAGREKPEVDGEAVEQWPLKSPSLQPEPEPEPDKPKTDAGYKTVPTVSACQTISYLFLLLVLLWLVAEGKIIL